MKTNNSKIQSNQRNSLGMSKMVYTQLLAKLESIGEHVPDQPAKRQFTRLEYFDPYFELTLDSTKHSQRRKIAVATRNLSRGGMSILHSSFIYPNTQINATLNKASGEQVKVTGKVCRCEHRGGVVHEIGIKFDHEIVIQEFITPNILDGINSLETVDPTKLSGKILFVGTDPSITPFIREYLLTTSLNFGFKDGAEEALHESFDEYNLVFVSLDAGNMSGPEFIRCLRDSGFKKPIILCGKSDDSDSVKQQIKLSAADMFLPIPITENSLLCALGEFLVNNWTQHTLETVRNSVDLDSVSKLLEELETNGRDLDRQVKSENAVEIYITCTKIRNIALLLGMKSLHNLTLTVCDEIADTGEIEKFADELSSINMLCKTANEADRADEAA